MTYVREDESDEDEEDSVKKRDEFVRNPAEVREEKERKWAEQNARRGGGRGNRDVVGRAKGQGQEKQVLLNRSRKNANKGKGIRVAAYRKQAGGMF